MLLSACLFISLSVSTPTLFFILFFVSFLSLCKQGIFIIFSFPTSLNVFFPLPPLSLSHLQLIYIVSLFIYFYCHITFCFLFHPFILSCFTLLLLLHLFRLPCRSICVTTSLYLPTCLSIYLSVYLFNRKPVGLSIGLSPLCLTISNQPSLFIFTFRLIFVFRSSSSFVTFLPFTTIMSFVLNGLPEF